MLISDAERILFVHVPKTGGVSVELMLKKRCPDFRLKPAARPIGRHAPLARILRTEPEVADYWTFGIVRNPWARMVSWYSMIDFWNHKHGPASGKPQNLERNTPADGNAMWRTVVSDYDGFDDFVLRGTDELPRVGKPQWTYLSAPKLGKEADFIGRTESFAEDLAVVQRRLGVEPTPPPHRNSSSHGSYRDYFTDATRKKVAEVYAEDIDRFGYTF